MKGNPEASPTRVGDADLPETVRVLEALFVNRRDTYAVQKADGAYLRVEKPLTTDAIGAHLEGRASIGTYQVNPNDNTVIWLGFDFDGENLEELKPKVGDVRQAALGLGVPERSMAVEFSGRRGFHLWLFFLKPVPLAFARAFGMKVFADSKLEWEYKNEKGDVIASIELFPKQEKVPADGFGNFIKLPLGIHKGSGKRSHFVRPSDYQELPWQFLRWLRPWRVPSDLIEKLTASPPRSQGGPKAKVKRKTYAGANAPCVKLMLEGTVEGHRDEHGIRIASYFSNMKRWGKRAVLDELVKWNQKNQPPLDERKLHELVQTAEKGGYVWNCDDEVLKEFCKPSPRCPLCKPKLEARGPEEPPKKPEEMEREKKLREAALEWLKSPNILHDIKEVLGKGIILDRYRFVLDEDGKKILLFLIALSAKTPWPQNSWITGDSGYGKSNLAITALGLFPKGYYKKRSYITSGAMRHGEQNYRVLFLQEFLRRVEQDVRLFSKEDGGYAFEIAVKDPETKEWTTKVVEIPAKTFITTSAESLPSPQLLRRVWLLSVDEGDELTKKINKRKADYRAGKAELASPEKIEKIRMAVDLLEPKPVVIPYAEYLADLAPWDRTSLDNLYDVISIIANLYQFQRDQDGQGGIVASLADLYWALSISWPILAQTLQKLPDRLRKCLEELKKASGGLTSKELAQRIGKAQSTVRGYLGDLVNLGYVYEDTSSRPRLYSPSAQCVEVLNSVEKVVQHSKWQEIIDFAERSDNKALFRSVEVSCKDSNETTIKRGKDKADLGEMGQNRAGTYLVFDPINGSPINLKSGAAIPPTPTNSQHFEEGEDKGGIPQKGPDIGEKSICDATILSANLQHIEEKGSKGEISQKEPEIEELSVEPESSTHFNTFNTSTGTTAGGKLTQADLMEQLGELYKRIGGADFTPEGFVTMAQANLRGEREERLREAVRQLAEHGVAFRKPKESQTEVERGEKKLSPSSTGTPPSIQDVAKVLEPFKGGGQISREILADTLGVDREELKKILEWPQVRSQIIDRGSLIEGK